MKAFILVAALLTSSVAYAAEVDFTTPITDLDGKPVTMNGKPDGEPLTLRTVAESALMASYDDEKTLPGDKKTERLVLALQIHTAAKIDLTAENTAMLKMLIGKAYGPLVVGRAFSIIDPASMKK